MGIRRKNVNLLNLNKPKVQDLVTHSKGNEIFASKVRTLDKDSSIKHAAEYFLLAFKNTKQIMHFKSKTLVKRLYFLLTHSVYESFILMLSYIYLLLSFLEPGNHAERPFDPKDSVYITISCLEAFIISMFILDILIMSYVWFVQMKQQGCSFDFWYMMISFCTMCIVVEFLYSIISYNMGFGALRVLWIFWGFRLIMSSEKLYKLSKAVF